MAKVVKYKVPSQAANGAQTFSDSLVGNQITGFSFAANYDGRNFSIDNLYINRSPHYVALFGNCNNATIKNLILNSQYLN